MPRFTCVRRAMPKYDPCKPLRRRICRTRTIYPTSKASLIERHAVLSVTESSASFAIIAAAGPSVRPGASSVSGCAGRVTAGGYGDFELLDEASRDPGRGFRCPEFRRGSRHVEHAMDPAVRFLDFIRYDP